MINTFHATSKQLFNFKLVIPDFEKSEKPYSLK